MSSAAYTQDPILTNAPKHITISEIEARKALKYKADAEFFFQRIQMKDSIIVQKDSIIIKQQKKLFWTKVEVWAWRALALYTLIKVAK